jgi:hypothetical protein
MAGGECTGFKALFPFNFTLKLNGPRGLKRGQIQSESKIERGLKSPLKKEHSI